MPEDAHIRTRHTLLNRLKNRDDQTSWDVFFNLYRQLIYNLALKAGLTDAEAQEVLQETMLAVTRKIGKFEVGPERGSFSAWLMRLTRWRISDQFKKRRKLGSPNSLQPEPGPDDNSLTSTLGRIPDPAGCAFERAWTEEWQKNLAAAALERVKLQIGCKQFQIFDLHVLQNLSVAETAQTLGVSAASVYVAKYGVSRLLHRQLNELRGRL